MSARGRRLSTGTPYGMYGFLIGIGILCIWFAPQWVERLFPNFLIFSNEPWQLTSADLTWQRNLSNVIVKPGFRFIVICIYSVTISCIRYFLIEKLTTKPMKRWQKWHHKLASSWVHGSGEFVVEGRRSSLMIEYARGVQAV